MLVSNLRVSDGATKVLTPSQAAAKGAFNAAMPSGKPGKAEPAEKEDVYAELEAVFGTMDWSDPDKKVPGLDDGAKLDEAEFASYIGAHATLSESECVWILNCSAQFVVLSRCSIDESLKLLPAAVSPMCLPRLIAVGRITSQSC